MESNDRQLISMLREQIDHLLRGEAIEPVGVDATCSPEVLALAESCNRFISQRTEAEGFISALASGNLGVTPPPRNMVASPFKQLHAALQHLTWQTRQIADGDYNQRVHFMGDFSIAFNSMIEALAEKKRVEAHLRASQAQVRQLEGIIPICSYCKKIRDDQNYWQQLEQYISDHSEALFSHGICPSCLEEQMALLQSIKPSKT